jgi:UDP-N-acetylglucosamine 2-epimerase (non-hydrolysing)
MTSSSVQTATGPILCVIGTRPNYMKIAPILRAFSAHQPKIDFVLVHTGQHYDKDMERVFFEALGAPDPDVNLAVGPANHAMQTGEMMKLLDPLFDQHHPRACLVVGDVNSTLAAALVASKRGVPLIHVESGLRSNDRSMPEELNRIVVDQLSDLLFTTERQAKENLTKEGIPTEKIEFVGNVMIDSLESARASVIAPVQVLSRFLGEQGASVAARYGLVTLHRPSNVDSKQKFSELLGVLSRISHELPLVFAVHPRTKSNIDKFDLASSISPNLHLLPPQGYFEMLGLMKHATIVLTDSGGIQEETTMLSVPCLTLRENTERPITITEGTNALVGTDPDAIWNAYRQVVTTGGKGGKRPEFWDGNTATRIAASVYSRYLR